MAYWHVAKKSLAIYSRIKRVSTPESAAMIEGVLNHCTDMEVRRQYVDSHGQTEIAFAFSRLLGFELAPRIKRVAYSKLYLSAKEDRPRLGNLTSALTRPINFELIASQTRLTRKRSYAGLHARAFCTRLIKRSPSLGGLLRRFLFVNILAGKRCAARFMKG